MPAAENPTRAQSSSEVILDSIVDLFERSPRCLTAVENYSSRGLGRSHSLTDSDCIQCLFDAILIGPVMIASLDIRSLRGILQGARRDRANRLYVHACGEPCSWHLHSVLRLLPTCRVLYRQLTFTRPRRLPAAEPNAQQAPSNISHRSGSSSAGCVTSRHSGQGEAAGHRRADHCERMSMDSSEMF
ncbi:uncharacterized protein LAESUDRAFT_719694 [Laetiporus sulphureus 93-53]|uniref:Uncharacterized protein n=1 Tax=Laetiporus sulphureus 93-53 TaxID=1314785 RepID=A0A165HHW2_9APHY|nr:uncharacterized protein LAESUDRAFT_719694 [Laetiporus sulphureus 93-53]KZT11753.1 hypothetical protein LAESUDRAFT_719694 [Laetiporus sulphureus 93-53]